MKASRALLILVLSLLVGACATVRPQVGVGAPLLAPAFTPAFSAVYVPLEREALASRTLDVWSWQDPAPATNVRINAPDIDVTSPVVTITSPTSSATYDAGTASTVALSGTSSDVGRGLGTPCSWSNSLTGGSGTSVGTTSWSIASIALNVGSNAIAVSCPDVVGNVGTDILTVTRSSASSSTCTPTIADADQGTVTTAIGLTSQGGAVCVPAMTGTWTTQGSIASKSITLMGQRPILSITNWTAASPTVLTVASTANMESGQVVNLASASGTGSLSVNGHAFEITVLNGTTFSIPVNLTGGAPTGGTATANATTALCAVPGQKIYTCFNRSSGPILTWATTTTSGLPGGLPNGYTRISGIGWIVGDGIGSPGCTTYDRSALTVTGSTQNLVLDGNYWATPNVGTSCGGVAVTGYVRGVAWGNSCRIFKLDSHCTINRHQSWLGLGSYGDRSWATASTVGTVDQMYWEDNVWRSNLGQLAFAGDEQEGSRTAWRYNRYLECNVWANHGLETGGRTRSAYTMELYLNFFSYPCSTVGSLSGLRGGSGISFSNTAVGNLTRVTSVTNFRSNNGDARGWYPWGQCGQASISITSSGTTATVTDSTHNFLQGGSQFEVRGKVRISGASPAAYNGDWNVFYWPTTAMPPGIDPPGTYRYTMLSSPGVPASGTPISVSPWDQNSNTAGKRCLDQPASGVGDLISGDLPTGPTPIAWTNQTVVPVLGWLNTNNGTMNVLGAETTQVLAAGVDYLLQNVGIDCTTVTISVGVIGSRPAAGCVEGARYWATDEGEWDASHSGFDGKLYAWRSGAWVAEYGASATGLPYTYPHPLRAF
jgi:hypothetical protein